MYISVLLVDTLEDGLADCVFDCDALSEICEVADWSELADTIGVCEDIIEGEEDGLELASIVTVAVFIAEEVNDTLEELEPDGLGDCVLD